MKSDVQTPHFNWGVASHETVGLVLERADSGIVTVEFGSEDRNTWKGVSR